MVLTPRIAEQIKEIVYKKPRSMDELSKAIGKNWRTANSYVEKIMQESGEIRVTTFREGSRGALKVVYWNNSEYIYASDVQKEIFEQIKKGIDKQDFSPSEIYQYVAPEKRDAYFETFDTEETYTHGMKDLEPYFKNTEKEIFILVGNLRFIHFDVGGGKTVLDFFKDCISRGVIIKIITEITFLDFENVELLLSLNRGLKDPLIHIKHKKTPLRAYLFDDSIIRFCEVYLSQDRLGEREGNYSVYYEIRDSEWVLWLQKLFWQEFQKGVPVSLRLDLFKSLRKNK
jgi:hypothetical protein